MIATTRRADKVERLRQTGADHVIVTANEGLSERVLALTGIGHLERGSFAPVIDRVFTLDQIVQAHAWMDAHQANSKLVVTVP